MRYIKLIFAVVTSMVGATIFAGPAFASTEGSCISVPLSPLMAGAAPTTLSALLLQLGMAVGIVLITVVVVLTPGHIVRPLASASSTGAGS